MIENKRIVSEQEIVCLLSDIIDSKQLYLGNAAFNDLKNAATLLYNHLNTDAVFNANVTICADNQEISNQIGLILAELMETWFSDCCLLVTEKELYNRKHWKEEYKKRKIAIVKDYLSTSPDHLFAVLSGIESERWAQSVVLCSVTNSLENIKEYDVQDYRLYHYLCGYKVVMPDIQESHISDIIFKRLISEGFELTDGFKKKLELYNRAVYPEAQLIKMNYVEDLIYRIFQVHYQKICEGNILDDSDVPYSFKADELFRNEQHVSNTVGESSASTPNISKEYNMASIKVDTAPDYEICGQQKNINVLLLALSTFSYDKSKKEYIVSETKFSYKDSICIGRYQLDPVPKLLSKELNQKHERLDYVIGFCTTKKDAEGNLLEPEVVKTKSVFVPIQESGEKGLVNISELDYFEKQIRAYLPDDEIQRLIPVIIDEGNPATGIEKAIKTIRNLGRDSDDELIGNVHLYLDSHGGFRDVQLTLQAVISLLGRDEITVEDSYSVKYGSGHNSVTIDKSTEMFDFASGINEFINYGRLQSLEKYFSNRLLENNDEINALLGILKKISDSISICDTMKFEEGLKQLTEYFSSGREFRKLDYLSIFADTIKNDFEGLLCPGRTVVDEIKWCLRKSFYQQALTLIEARMPREFVRNGLRYYCDESNSDVAKTVFDEFYNATRKNEKWKVEDPDHFFIKYYNIIKNGPTPIKNSIAAKHDNNANYILANKTLFYQNINDVNEFLDHTNLMYSYRSLCNLRNPINHGGRIDVSADELRLLIEQFITRYNEILKMPHRSEKVIQLEFCQNQFVLPLTIEWENEIIPSPEQYSEKELILMKMLQFTFKNNGYSNNRCEYVRLLSDTKGLCRGEIPKKADLGKSPLQLLHDISQGLFVREGNNLIWNPSLES